MRVLTIIVSAIELNRETQMITFLIFILCSLCALLGALALLLWLVIVVLQMSLHCVEKLLTNLTDGHVVVGLLYLVPCWFLGGAIVQGLCLAYSFYTAVLR
jgi:hypothetical protein